MKGGRWWVFLFAFLSVLIISGGAILIFHYNDGNHPVEIVISPTSAKDIKVNISGVVATEINSYPCGEDTTIGDILRAAGGITEDTSPANLNIYVSSSIDTPQSQKININTAEVWLLEALDGIGPELAQRIVEYRNDNGTFLTIWDLDKVTGIGEKTIKKNANRITVVD